MVCMDVCACACMCVCMYVCMCHIVGKFGESTLLKQLVIKVWQMNISTKRLLIVSTNIDGFSLANH